MKHVFIQDLKAGMILADDVMSNSGVVFLTRGMVLTDNHIQNLALHGISTVRIAMPKRRTQQLLTDQEKPNILLNQEYQRTIDKFKDLYRSVRLGKQVIIHEVQENIQPLLSEIIASNNILGSLRMIHVSDEYTYMHSINVGLMSSMIGKWLGYSENDLKNLALAGFMHDLGKSKIPLEVLNKPARLTAEEFELMKMHPLHGHQILSEAGDAHYDSVFGVLEHHERMDGRGYPNGSSGKDIHEFAKIIAVADVFDALTSDRVYKSKISPFRVAEMLMEESTDHLDPYITQIFLRNIAKFYVGNIVRLNNGEVGEIILVNKFHFTRPLIKCKDKFFDLASNYHLEIIEVIE